MMPEDGLDRLRDSDSIFLGAVGWPGVPDPAVDRHAQGHRPHPPLRLRPRHGRVRARDSHEPPAPATENTVAVGQPARDMRS
jgi:hypothetical protein